MNRLLLLALCVALPASADVYKCRLPDGRIEIANAPCGKSAGTLEQRPEESVSAERKAESERDLERQRAFVEKREAARREEEKLQMEREAREREAAARAAASTPAPAPAPAPTTTYVPVPVAVPVSPLDQCLQSAYRATTNQAERNRRIQQCQSTYGGLQGGGGISITIGNGGSGSNSRCGKNDKYCPQKN